MDKQKQIEEIVADISKVLSGVLVSEIVNVARFLDEQGYRKIRENAVVLTNEEFWALSNKFSKKELDEIVEFHKKKTCKETAEKFARLVDFRSVSTRDNNGREMFTISALGLKEIAKEITEGVK